MTLALHTPGNDELLEAGEEDINTPQQQQEYEPATPEEALVDDEDIKGIRSYFKTIFADLRHISMETKFSSYRQYTHNDSVEENNRYNLYMVAFESIFFVGICFAQVYHIKNFLENKRVI